MGQVSWKSGASQQGHEYGSRRIFTVTNHYQAMTSEDIEDFMCAVGTVICKVNIIITICSYDLFKCSINPIIYPNTISSH
jgi:hypothetical protein